MRRCGGGWVGKTQACKFVVACSPRIRGFVIAALPRQHRLPLHCFTCKCILKGMGKSRTEPQSTGCFHATDGRRCHPEDIESSPATALRECAPAIREAIREEGVPEQSTHEVVFVGRPMWELVSPVLDFSARAREEAASSG